MTSARVAPQVPLVGVLIAVLVLGCGMFSRPAPTDIGTTHPPAAPTRKPIDGKVVIEGLRRALGPDTPVRLKATADARIDQGGLTLLMDGDFQGNDMDAHVSFRHGSLQLSFDVIAADGKAYVRPYEGKWAKSSEKVPPEGGGPFGDMSKADLTFEGPSKLDRDLYLINWADPTHAARALHGTVFTSLKVKSAIMQFQVDANGKPYTATYELKGTGKVDGTNHTIKVNGYYQFFAIHDPLVFKAPMK